MKTENMKWLRAAAEEFLELLYPRRCPICQKILDRKEKLVCEECGRKLPYIREPLCKKMRETPDAPGTGILSGLRNGQASLHGGTEHLSV